MAEVRMYNGRPIKANVTIKEEMIDGEIRQVLVMPTGMKTPYADGVEKVDKRRTVKANPSKDAILNELLAVLQTHSAGGTIYKTGQGKFAVRTAEDKWFSLALTANKAEPKDLTAYEIPQDE